MVNGFLFRRIPFWPKNDSRGFLLHIHLNKYTIQDFFLPSFMNSGFPMFWGCIGQFDNIHLIECNRKFHKIDYIDILLENVFESSAKIFKKEERAFICQMIMHSPVRPENENITTLGGIAVLR